MEVMEAESAELTGPEIEPAKQNNNKVWEALQRMWHIPF